MRVFDTLTAPTPMGVLSTHGTSRSNALAVRRHTGRDPLINERSVGGERP
jgi:hypothetical protein